MALSDASGGPLPEGEVSLVSDAPCEVMRSSECNIGLSDAQSADLCKWLGVALAAERHAVNLELERSHQQLLADFTKWWGQSDEGFAPVLECSCTEISSSEPTMERKLKQGGSLADLEQAIGMKNDKQEHLGHMQHLSSSEGSDDLRQSVDLFLANSECFANEAIDANKALPTRPTMGKRPSVFGRSSQVPRADRWTHRLVVSTAFELTFALLICANTVVMAAEMQYVGMGLGKKLKFPMYVDSKEDIWPGADKAFIVLDWFFGIVFTLEILFKIVGLRSDFFRDAWNYLDVAIVATWLVQSLLREVKLPLDPLLLRLVRLARLVRLVKLLSSFNGVDHMFLMITTMKGCMAVLFWTGLFLFICQTMLAALLHQIVVTSFLSIDGLDQAKQRDTFKYFGTFARSMFSVFEITLGNWVPVARNLYENVSPWLLLFSSAHKLVFGFAVIGVINGIFIQETFKVAACDDTIMLLQEERAVRVHGRRMHKFFQEADKSGDGLVDRYEFKSILCRPEIKTWLAAQGLDAKDANGLFTLLATNNEKLSAVDLVRGVGKLKGDARSIDMALLMRHQNKLSNLMSEEMHADIKDLAKAMTLKGDVAERPRLQPLTQILRYHDL